MNEPTATIAVTPADQRRVTTLLRELRQVERELTERELVRRADALDAAQEGIERLSEIGSSAGILDRAAATLGASSSFARVVVSQVDGEALIPHSAWARAGIPPQTLERLRALRLALRYPLTEAEVAQRGGEAVAVDADGPRSPAELRELLGWDCYVVAPLQLRGNTIGLLHAEPAAGAPEPDRLDREVAAIYAKGLAAAFERAVLRETIQSHREELRGAVAWLRNHLDQDLAALGVPPAEPSAGTVVGEDAETLTPREAEVLGLLGQGQTNAAIAASLLISESTVKFHVKNILLKLGATSRADAVARHLRGN
jgi:DNA-binding CsgD family transcriptional regulator